MGILLFILFLLAAGVAYAFHLQLTALRKTDAERRRAAEAATESAQKVQKELEKLREEASRRRNEVSSLKEKLNDLRHRTHKQREAERKQRSARDTAIVEELEEARRALDEERARADVLSRDLTGLQAELKKQQDGVARLEQALAAARAAADRPAPPPPLPPEVAAVQAEKEKVQAELQGQIDALEKQLREARRKATDEAEAARKARGKTATVNRLHLLTKSELDLFKEKLVWSEKRVVELEKLLFANEIPLPEREAAPQPRAPKLAPALLAREEAHTGGEGVVAEAVDYVPEEGESASDADSDSSSDASATAEADAPAGSSDVAPAAGSDEAAVVAAEAAPASEAAPETAAETATETASDDMDESAAEAETETPAASAPGVQPVRRPREVVEARKAEG